MTESTLAWLFASGVAADVVLIVIALEAVWLRLRRRWLVIAIMCRLMPGLLMMLALRAALTGQGWVWIALPLTLSFPFHLADLRFGPGRRTKK
ncbi:MULTISPECIES: hypothetical protein [unclassified Sphingomonas]|uniref:hypothetical protein n=1 Tax=unclassified Sphingomonas TaxID=196159 RepID=UPI000BD5503E|nr:MAG: hypothetical protein B7Z43_02660 [Sphingomonas sp. 12-62-6]OYX40277.1 MAG: hypothetical protein B7Y98_02775 [Sphingomonas sp. 32-62-10]